MKYKLYYDVYRQSTHIEILRDFHLIIYICIVSSWHTVAQRRVTYWSETSCNKAVTTTITQQWRSYTEETAASGSVLREPVNYRQGPLLLISTVDIDNFLVFKQGLIIHLLVIHTHISFASQPSYPTPLPIGFCSYSLCKKIIPTKRRFYKFTFTYLRYYHSAMH